MAVIPFQMGSRFIPEENKVCACAVADPTNTDTSNVKKTRNLMEKGRNRREEDDEAFFNLPFCEIVRVPFDMKIVWK